MQNNKVDVRVSKEMRELCDTLTMLNKFVWTSDIAYLFSLDRGNKEFINCLDEKAYIKLRDLPTEAWVPTNQGQIKYDRSLGQFLEDVVYNRVNVYKSALIFYNTAFEDYLKSRCKYTGGKFLSFFYNEKYVSTKYPIREKIIYLADVCKQVRNLIVHEKENSMPIDNKTSRKLFDDYFNDIRGKNEKKLENKNANQDVKTKESKYSELYKKRFIDIDEVNEKKLYSEIDESWKRFFHNADDMVEKNITNYKIQIDHIYFYMLFTFTNYTDLAFEIEENLFDTETYTEILKRSPQKIRRGIDMII